MQGPIFSNIFPGHFLCVRHYYTISLPLPVCPSLLSLQMQQEAISNHIPLLKKVQQFFSFSVMAFSPPYLYYGNLITPSAKLESRSPGLRLHLPSPR